MAQKEKLELRRKIKGKKPKYTRVNGHKVKEIKRTGWRKPKGKHDKTRRQHKSKPLLVQPGFGSPIEVRGLLRNGLEPLLVRNVADLNGADPKIHGIIIGSTVGMRKKIDIVNKANELKITLVNIKNPKDFVAKCLEERKSLSEKKDKIKKTREKKAEERAKKKEKKETIDKKVENTETEEEKLKKKKEQDKVLTQKQKD